MLQNILFRNKLYLFISKYHTYELGKCWVITISQTYIIFVPKIGTTYNVIVRHINKRVISREVSYLSIRKLHIKVNITRFLHFFEEKSHIMREEVYIHYLPNLLNFRTKNLKQHGLIKPSYHFYVRM